MRLARHRLLLAVVILSPLLVGCPASAPRAPSVDPAAAASYSAELTAAQTDHRETLREAEAARVAAVKAYRKAVAAGGEAEAKPTYDMAMANTERIRVAGKSLDSAMQRFWAELRVYLSTGVESDAFNRAHARMNRERENLATLWEAVKRGS